MQHANEQTYPLMVRHNRHLWTPVTSKAYKYDAGRLRRSTLFSLRFEGRIASGISIFCFDYANTYGLEDCV